MKKVKAGMEGCSKPRTEHVCRGTGEAVERVWQLLSVAGEVGLCREGSSLLWKEASRKRLLQLQSAGSPGPQDRPRGMQGLWN